jgi:transposase-like protein
MELKIPITFAMLRGIIDGDGSFSRINKTRARLNITTGSKKFAQQVFNFLKENNFNPTLTSTISNRKNRYYSVNMFRQKELSLLYDLLYSDAKYFLKRKYLKIGSLLGKPSK